MKKKIFGAVAVVALAAAVTFNVNLNSQDGQLPSVSLDNVEALANESGVVKCPGGNTVCAYNSNNYKLWKK